jgi:hypothetical protein
VCVCVCVCVRARVYQRGDSGSSASPFSSLRRLPAASLLRWFANGFSTTTASSGVASSSSRDLRLPRVTLRVLDVLLHRGTDISVEAINKAMATRWF